MLSDLQHLIAGIYDADCGHRLRDFLITDRALASHLGSRSLDSDIEETVLVAQDGDDLALSVYLDAALLSRLDNADPIRNLQADQLADLSIVLEGISHFNYLGWCASKDRPVTLLELELQAEIDKYVATGLLAQEQQAHSLAHRLHRWIFDDVDYRPALDNTERERYETANSYAARFCRRLLERITDRRWHRRTTQLLSPNAGRQTQSYPRLSLAAIKMAVTFVTAKYETKCIRD